MQEICESVRTRQIPAVCRCSGLGSVPFSTRWYPHVQETQKHSIPTLTCFPTSAFQTVLQLKAHGSQIHYRAEKECFGSCPVIAVTCEPVPLNSSSQLHFWCSYFTQTQLKAVNVQMSSVSKGESHLWWGFCHLWVLMELMWFKGASFLLLGFVSRFGLAVRR